MFLYLCPECGARESGRFCSECGAQLVMPMENLPDILFKHLQNAGFKELDGEMVSSSEIQDEVRSVAKGILGIFNHVFFITDNLPGSPLDISFVMVTSAESITKQFLDEVNTIYNMFCALSYNRLTIQNNIQLFVIVSCHQLRRRETRNIRRYSKESRKVFQKTCLVFVPVDLDKCKVYLSIVDPLYEVIRNALRQCTNEYNSDTRKTSFPYDIIKELYLKIIKDPCTLYFSGVIRLISPSRLARVIRSDLLQMTDFVELLLGTILICAVLSRIFGVNDPIDIDMPVVSDVIMASILLLYSLCYSFMMHVWLKILGGIGKIRHSFLSSLYFTVVTFPIQIITFAVIPGYKLWGNDYGINYLALLYAFIYKVHAWKAAVGAIVAFAALSILWDVAFDQGSHWLEGIWSND